MKLILYRLLFLLLLVGCGTQLQPLEKTKTTKEVTIKEIVKDTIIKIQKDSSYYKAWIECKDNKPVLRHPLKDDSTIPSTIGKPAKKKGQYLEPPNLRLNGNLLEASCEAKAQELFFVWKEKFVQEQTTEVREVILPPIEVPRPLTWWQKLWIDIGQGVSCLIIIWLLTKISWRSLFKLLKLV